MVTSLLHKLDGCHDNVRLGVRAQLHLLSCSDGRATLVGIRDYLAVPSFKSGIDTLHVLDQDMYTYIFHQQRWNSFKLESGVQTGTGRQYLVLTVYMVPAQKCCKAHLQICLSLK